MEDAGDAAGRAGRLTPTGIKLVTFLRVGVAVVAVGVVVVIGRFADVLVVEEGTTAGEGTITVLLEAAVAAAAAVIDCCAIIEESACA